MTHARATDNIIDGVINFIAGSAGGITSVCVGQPLDTVKVKLQTFPHLYESMFECFAQTVSKEGILRGLYAGTLPAVAANVAENSVLFAAYGACQTLIKYFTNKEKKDELSILGNASAGFLAAFFSSFALCPTELIKCKLQASREVLQSCGSSSVAEVSSFAMTKSVIQKNGIRGLFKGLDSTMAREMPGYFVFFGSYELTRTLLTPPGFTKDCIGISGTMISGAVGGMSFWICIFPADVIKSRLQVSDVKGNMFQLMVDITKKEGILALYSGLGPTLLRTIPATAALFLVYEKTKKLFQDLIEPPSSVSQGKTFFDF